MDTTRAHRLKSWLWALVPVLTLGFGTAAIMVYAVRKKASRPLVATLPVYAAGLALVLLADPDYGNTQESLFGIGMSINMGLGVLHAVTIRSWVFDELADRSRLKDRQLAALAAHHAATDARRSARRMLEQQPELARELMIGRPDIPGRAYPDGGLVDVNQVSADVLAGTTAMQYDLARRIIATRDEVGGFSSYEDMLLLTEVDHRAVEPYADLLVFSLSRD